MTSNAEIAYNLKKLHNNMALSKFLDSIGLDEKDQKVYLALLKLVDAPISRIAKVSGIQRTTAYYRIEKLIKLGLASSYRHHNVKRFVAENPNKIRGVLESKMLMLDKYLPELQTVSLERKLVNLRLFEGIGGRKQMIEEELNCKEKIVRSIGYARDLRKVQGGSMGFSKRRIEKKVFSKCLRPQDDEFDKEWLASQQKELREVRLLPPGTKPSGMIFVFDNKISIIAPEEEEGIGFLIESKSLSATMKSIFDVLWEMSRRT